MTTAAPLTALGKEVHFADGSTARVRYSLASLATLEDRYGSIDGILGAFGDIESSSTGMDRPMIGSLLEILGAGLLGSGFVQHRTERTVTERTEHPDGRKTSRDVREVTGIRYVRQSDRQELGHLLDLAQLEPAIEALSEAFAEAFPQGEAPAPAGPITDVELTIPATFLGTSSTTSAPSPSAAPTPPSGN
ncbi:hypothetical protein ACIQUY_31975 [Streptomyces sp. NPDC090231]|uniref:hypothetical protein n=1 Tax=unclassified Streptomyces TaxID=2593676 RepID=UPI003821DB2E